MWRPCEKHHFKTDIQGSQIHLNVVSPSFYQIQEKARSLAFFGDKNQPIVKPTENEPEPEE
jgi:hypothetical protein